MIPIGTWGLDKLMVQYGAEHCTQALCGMNACPACFLLHWKLFFIVSVLALAGWIWAVWMGDEK